MFCINPKKDDSQENNTIIADDLIPEICQMQFEIKKLREEKNVVRSQVSVLEDTNNIILAENNELKESVCRLQLMVIRMQQTERELQACLRSSEDDRTVLESQLGMSEKCILSLNARITNLETLEKSRHAFKNELSELNEQLQRARRDAAVARLGGKKMIASLNRQNNAILKLTEQYIQQKEQLEAKNVECSALAKGIEELSEANKALRKEVVALEARVRPSRSHCNSSPWDYVSCQELTTRMSSYSDFLECSEADLVTESSFSHITSTPVPSINIMPTVSLCSEMKDVVSTCKDLPTPFCGRQFFIPNTFLHESVFICTPKLQACRNVSRCLALGTSVSHGNNLEDTKQSELNESDSSNLEPAEDSRELSKYVTASDSLLCRSTSGTTSYAMQRWHCLLVLSAVALLSWMLRYLLVDNRHPHQSLEEFVLLVVQPYLSLSYGGSVPV